MNLTLLVDSFLFCKTGLIFIKVLHSTNALQIFFSARLLYFIRPLSKLSKPLIDVEEIIYVWPWSAVTNNKSVVDVGQICTDSNFVAFVIRIYVSNVLANRL